MPWQPKASMAGEWPGHLQACKSDLECLQGTCQQKKVVKDAGNQKKTPHFCIKETLSRLKDSLEEGNAVQQI